MALNPFFLQGSKGEQNLVQDLVNEHLKMHGIEFVYMPRVYVTSKDVMREVVDSKFDKINSPNGSNHLTRVIYK